MASRERSVERVYLGLVQDLSGLLEAARRSSARAINSVMTTTYWEIGRRIVEFEQGGSDRAAYGTEVLARLGKDLSRRFGRGFSRRNLQQMRAFYQAYSSDEIWQTVSAKSASTFPLPWSHYTRLLGVQNPPARKFYESEALRGGWSVRQLDRQIATQFYERTAQSKNKAAMLAHGAEPWADDAVRADEQVKDPLVLEFLGLKDEYSEYRLVLPDEKRLARELQSTRRRWERNRLAKH